MSWLPPSRQLSEYPGLLLSDASFLTCLSSCATTAGLHFVVSTDVEKPNPELRKFIRSHCMLGKNRGKTLPPRKRKPKRTQDASTSSESPASSTTTTVSRHILPVTVPRKFGSDLSTIRFANTVEPRVAEVVLQCGLYHLSVSAMQTAYHLNTSLFHCQADSLPPRDMHLLREEGRGMDSASSI